MKQELIDQFITDINNLNVEVSKIPSPMLQTIAWMKGLVNLLNPIWQDGHAVGLEEGKKQKASTVIKKLTNEN